eukprot:6407351-Amphidinium_carterae.1
MLRDAPRPAVPTTGPPTVMPKHVHRIFKIPVSPPDALTQDVNPSQFSVFEWKKKISAAPYAVSRDDQCMESYKPIGSNVIGFKMPFDCAGFRQDKAAVLALG